MKKNGLVRWITITIAVLALTGSTIVTTFSIFETQKAHKTDIMYISDDLKEIKQDVKWLIQHEMEKDYDNRDRIDHERHP